VPPLLGLRRIGRRFARQLERVAIFLEGRRRAWEAPHRWIGWWVAHIRLWRRPTIGMPTIFAVAVFALVAVLAFASLPGVDPAASKTLKSVFFGAAATGLIVAIWGDLFRLPYHSRRIRRRIARDPWCVLPTTAGKRKAELIARDNTTRMVPRQELYDELLPGILDRSQKDTQMIVGEPGAGKTTALVGISQLLARIGIVPVVVPLWGEMPDNLVDAAKRRFVQHSSSLLHSEARLDELWQWLRVHRRLVILVDDLDRIAPDGERGFLLRSALGELADEGLPAVVTTRPAGIPAGLAASAISLENLDEEAAVKHVISVAEEQPGTIAKAFDSDEVRGNVKRWVSEGRLAEVPFYLELLARLVAAERCEELTPAGAVAGEDGSSGRIRRRADGHCEWNPVWVRFLLLERFYDEVADGTVHRWLGIDVRERSSCLEALSEAALAQLAATALNALPKAPGDGNDRISMDFGEVGGGGTNSIHVDVKRLGNGDGDETLREEIEQFLDTDDRSSLDSGGQRMTVSAHEVVSTAERLRILDRDPKGKLHFNHRILQAYLAGRCLAGQLDNGTDDGAESHPLDRPGDQSPDWPESHPLDWLGALLDSRHPERMTANMTLMFAALRASRMQRGASGSAGAKGVSGKVGIVLSRLVREASDKLPDSDSKSKSAGAERKKEAERRLDPRVPFDPEGNRVDPDDALAKLTTATEIAAATGELDLVGEILAEVRNAAGATRWTKLNAIPAIATLKTMKEVHWTRIWEFARDPDQGVRRAASEAIADDAPSAYDALSPGIAALLDVAALRSAANRSLDAPLADAEASAADSSCEEASKTLEHYGITSEKDRVLSLRALGWVLPAIVSGLREHPGRATARDLHLQGDEAEGRMVDGDGLGLDKTEYDKQVSSASQALTRLVTLAFQRKFPKLEASVAQGFKSDAMRHADDPEHPSGPGLVAGNRKLVTDICIENACHWYARMVLHQALALYTVAGSDAGLAFNVYQRALHRGGEPHPLVSRAARHARRAVARYLIGSDAWRAFVWADEGDAASRRQAALNPIAAQLVADVTLLLNLDERAPEDRQEQFARMNELPHCLHRSRERLEILGAGCSSNCKYGFCPLKEAPVDEPDGQRTISRAFCRGQQRVAGRRVPPWERRIHRKALKRFWKEMERRART
jgi:hypothetical protein